ncbi:dihydrolipoyl dehydrogenase family protein [Gryllotalpicola protaetiae]|uniref:NAD(P)/FAD-dependent oxidoreductase n=1 Tax=Gryllotalpicola protaetiae TaxID=2419771 RepID=A0A387BNS7_9MICO|nr:NAD(P)/FAD-dependent oxidoreductase [Gryllotalpicola protaetiae]AYG04358.1 NAD(P)/FAD-dependent oxidoreductase [Gryllotalpicola protaetiae]
MTTTYDLIVIGGGAVGENVADRAVQGGLSTVIVEAELVGGECSYWACMPSKALLRGGGVLDVAQRTPGVREMLSGSIDVPQVLKRRNSVTSNWKDDGQLKWLDSAHIDLVRGHAVFTGPKALRVTAADGTVTELTANHAIAVSTGSLPLIPDTPGLAEAEPWASREATSAQEVPSSLAIIGGGVVAAEMATAYTSLGASVTLIARGKLLANQEPFAGEKVADALTKAGADVRLGTSVERVETADSGEGHTLLLSDGTAITAEKILVATGRVPRSGDLGLEAIGLPTGGWLKTDDSLRVLDADGAPIDWLYAAGDITGRALLTHQGKYQARIAGDAIAARALGRPVDTSPWGVHSATADHAAVPQVTFTSPEVASVGLTAAEAEKRGIRTRVVDYEIGWVAGATIHSEGYEGTARAVVDEDRHVLVGVTFVGTDVGELLHAATIAVTAEVPLERLWHAVPSYPTLSEVWLRLLETYGRPTA